MSSSVASKPALVRRSKGRLLGGVAGGIADHVGLPVAVIRVVFVLLASAAGLGVVIYGAFWIVLPTPADAGPSRFPQWVEYVLAGASGLVALVVVFRSLPLGQLFVPVILACLGAALLWRQANETQRAQWWQLSRSSLGSDGQHRNGRIRIATGVSLVVLGGVLVLFRADISAVRDGFVAMAVTAAGIALVTGPWWMRTVTELSDERRERIRSQERAELAAHLHDSVLQTLALIQRNAESPREVARLARGQERELRTLLYGPAATQGQLAAALRLIAAEVEDAYAIAVEVVVVGDLVLDDRLAALVAATREALVNAGKHAQVDSVSLYAEVEDDACTVFVKDRGLGFEPNAVADDRHGLRDSIGGRLERHGGRLSVQSSPGGGTEIEMSMPR